MFALAFVIVACLLFVLAAAWSSEPFRWRFVAAGLAFYMASIIVGFHGKF